MLFFRAFGFLGVIFPGLFPLGTSAVSVNPNSRLAAWSKVYDCDNGDYFPFEPHVYFQLPNGNLGEALYFYDPTCGGIDKPGVWSKGGFYMNGNSVRANTPIATVSYPSGAYVYFVDRNDRLVVSEYANGYWSGPWPLGQTVDKSAKSIAVWRDWLMGKVTVWFQSDSDTVKSCTYTPGPSHPPCTITGNDQTYDAFPGVGMTASSDLDGYPIFAIQANRTWGLSMRVYWHPYGQPDKYGYIDWPPEGTQVADAYGAVPGNGFNNWVFLMNENKGIGAYQWNGNTRSYEGPQEIAGISPIPSVANGIAATASHKTQNIRVWYVTASNHIAEAVYLPNQGWTEDNDDILHTW